MVGALWDEVRVAGRSLRRSRAFGVAAVATLALAIGATTAVFAVLSAVLLRPLPYRESDRLVMVWQEYVSRGWGIVGVSHPNLAALGRYSRTLEAVAGFQPQSVSVTTANDAERIDAARVTTGLFAMLGIAPAAGRFFNDEDARAGAVPVVVVSEAFSHRVFGAEAAALGRTITVNGEEHRVVGVMPSGSEFPPRFRMTLESASVTMPAVDLWMPLALNTAPGRVGFRDTLALARLSPGATIDAAQSEARTISESLLREFPGPANSGLTLAVVPLSEQMVGAIRRPLLLMMAAVALVVLIACANVASMLVARAASRRGEIAIRAALGASPSRLRWQTAAESFLLAGTSAALGLGLAIALVRVMTASIASQLPQFRGIEIDVRLVAFVALLAMVAAFLFGAVPAMYVASLSRARHLAAGAKGVAVSPAGAAMRRTILAFQAALAIFLLAGAGLMTKSFYELVSFDLGFTPAGRLAAGLALPPAVAAGAENRRAIAEALVARLAAIPGVDRVAVSSSVPLSGDVGTGGLTIAGRPLPSGDRPHAAQRRIDHRYFDVMGMRIVRGRGFTAGDRMTPVAVINEAAARQFWPGGDPIGQRIRPDGFGDDLWLTVVGVVKDVRYAAVSAPAGAEVYWPYALTPPPRLVVVLRHTVGAATLTAALRREVRQLDARLPALGITTLDDLVAEAVAEPRLLVLLLSVFAVFALVVATSGIYGLASYILAQRRDEIAVRLALGASPGRIARGLMAEGMIPVGIGAAAGLVIAPTASPVIAEHLFNVAPSDPVTLVVVSLILLGTAGAACYGPARRASAIDPLAALRSE